MNIPQKRERINRDKIMDNVAAYMRNPLIPAYSDNEREVIQELENTKDPYKIFVSRIVRSWIDGSRYIQSRQTASQEKHEHIDALIASNFAYRDNAIAYYNEIHTAQIDVAQAVEDGRQTFTDIYVS
jgi:hypothetical protein